MEQILLYIAEYGLAVFIIATAIILTIGILKVCKVFDKIQNKDIKKIIYYGLDVVLAFGYVALYYVIFNLEWHTYWILCITQMGATTTLYNIYENFGLRKLLQMFLAWFTKVTTKKNTEKFAQLVQDMGLSNALAELRTLINDAAHAQYNAQNDEQKGS